MLCNSCLRQQVCLTSKLAQSDRTLQPMLKKLKKCELRIVRSAQRKTDLMRRIDTLIQRCKPSGLLFATKQSK